MILNRILDPQTARFVAYNVRKHNHIPCRWQKVIRYPHYGIRVDDKLAGWIGFRPSRKDVYELIHMTILPEYRRQGLAKESVLQVLHALHGIGGEWAWVRISNRNDPSMSLATDLGFRMTRRKGKVNVYSRKLDESIGVAAPAAAEEEEMGEEGEQGW